MMVQWEDDGVLVADKRSVAAIYGVSIRTVERRCTPLRYEARAGARRGATGIAIYDALKVADDLEQVQPRAPRTAAGLRARMQRRYLT
jgi:DNA-binding transcriptional MocR family regulator